MSQYRKTPVVIEASASQLERDVQRAVIAVYERFGCVVARTSPGRKGGTHQTPGIPDLYVFPPVRQWPNPSAPWWHESKREGGKQRPAQREWQARCEARGVAYVLGGVAAALTHLRQLGLVA